MTVEKTGKNNHHNYNYVEAEQIIRTIRPLLTEEGLLFLPSVLEVTKEENYAHVKMSFSLIDSKTGEKIETFYYGEGKDNNDKAYYKAYTGALKYYFIQTFLIPTGEDPEKDSSVQNDQYKKQKASSNELKGPMKFIQKQKDLWAQYNNGDLSGFNEWHEKTSARFNGYEKGILEHLESLIESRKQNNG